MAPVGTCPPTPSRTKDASDDEVRQAAAEIQPMCKEQEAVFLLDDRGELAKELHADGVHLGKNDMPIDEARRILGEEYIIGGTANTFEDIQRIAAQGADYIGCGPFRFTTTKKNLAPVLGVEGYRDIIAKMRNAGINIPMVAIGGITPDDIDEILATGVQGIAVSGTVLNADDPVAMMKSLLLQNDNKELKN